MCSGIIGVNMSRLANMPIIIPSTVKVSSEAVDGSTSLTISNGKVEESWKVHPAVKVEVVENEVRLSMSDADKKDKFSRSMLGTDYRHIEKLVTGMDKPYETVLEIHGLGYRAKLAGKQVVLALGKSHDDAVEIPENVQVEVPNEREIVCKSHSKKKLGDFVASVCALRKPDAYKAKGVRIRGRHYRTKSEK